jgi:hypothetical protein
MCSHYWRNPFHPPQLSFANSHCISNFTPWQGLNSCSWLEGCPAGSWLELNRIAAEAWQPHARFYIWHFNHLPTHMPLPLFTDVLSLATAPSFVLWSCLPVMTKQWIIFTGNAIYYALKYACTTLTTCAGQQETKKPIKIGCPCNTLVGVSLIMIHRS